MARPSLGSYDPGMTVEARPVEDPAARSARLGVRHREGIAGLFVAFVVALVLHLGLVPAVGALRPVKPPALQDGAQTGALALGRVARDNKRVPIALRLAREPLPAQEKPSRAPDEEPEAPGQVVSLPPPDRDERPESASFAAEWNHKTDRETRSRDARLRSENITSVLQQGPQGSATEPPAARPESPTVVRSPPAPPKTASSGPVGQGRAPSGASGSDTRDGGGQPAFVFEVPRQARREALDLAVTPEGWLRNREAVAEVPGTGGIARLALGPRPADAARLRGSGSAGDDLGQGLLGGGDGSLGLPSLAQLTPSREQLVRLAGAPVADHLPEVETDAATRLNAWRWKHATFFNRIADAIRKAWNGGQVLSATDPSGHVYGFEDRTTLVRVTLDREGHIVSMHVASTSGALALDEEALRAFRIAAPFANPPAQLFRERETFTFEFGFHVTYGRMNLDWRWRPD